jgi:hypothetical protein
MNAKGTCNRYHSLVGDPPVLPLNRQNDIEKPTAITAKIPHDRFNPSNHFFVGK